jgi:hypothetical protein
MSSMTSVNAILESVGINHADLTAQVNEHRRMRGDLVPASRFPVGDLACALEQLASRLASIADGVASGIGDYYVGDMAADVISMVTDGGKDPLELVRTHLGPDAGQALLTISPVFGHPDLRCVNHTVPDHSGKTSTLTSYLVDVRTGDVTPVPGGPTTIQEEG